MSTKKRYKVLQLDGGGLLGIIFLKFLCEVEKKTGKKIHDIFDMFIGTSTGGIAGAMFAKGYTAQEILNFYKNHGKKIFTKRLFGFLNPGYWMKGRYNRKYIDKLCDEKIPGKMKDLNKPFICTGINMLDDQYTHFFKSYKDKYKDKNISEIVKRTYSAPTYFGYYKDNIGIWSDGGVGVHNCTLLHSYIEMLRLKHKKYYILSCGCGKVTPKADKTGLIDQIKDFIPIARRQSIEMQVKNCNELKVNFDRVNIDIKVKHDKMDNYKLIPIFENYGELSIKENLMKVLNKLK